MNADREALAALEVDALRLRLRLQRATIADRLGPPAAAQVFPRSRTMRLVLRHPWIVARLLAGLRPRRGSVLRAGGFAALALALAFVAAGRRPRSTPPRPRR